MPGEVVAYAIDEDREEPEKRTAVDFGVFGVWHEVVFLDDADDSIDGSGDYTHVEGHDDLVQHSQGRHRNVDKHYRYRGGSHDRKIPKIELFPFLVLGLTRQLYCLSLPKYDKHYPNKHNDYLGNMR